jgi:DNA-directed RNA polymerase specialized sigma24 family protein
MMSTSRRLNPFVIHVRANADDKAAQNALAGAVRELLIRSLCFHGLSKADAEDRAQDKVMLLFEHLKNGDVEQGNEEAYVWKAGNRAAQDSFRKKGREDESIEKLRSAEATGTTKGAVPKGAPAPGPEPDCDGEEILAFLLSDNTGMPETYRNVLAEVYVDGHTIAELAQKELEANPTNTGSGVQRTLKQARATVDQRLTRARRWVTRHLAARQKKGTN